MKFDLQRPCKDCPFRTDCMPGWLGAARAESIVGEIVGEGKTFACHKTTQFAEGPDGEDVYAPNGDEQHCAGALLLIERTGRPHRMTQIAERFGLYDPAKLDRGSPVFATPAEFIEHHT